MSLIQNKRDFKRKHEIIEFNDPSSTKDGTSKWTITEAKELLQDLMKRIMYAESNELISSFLRQNGMDEAQIETAIQQLNKLREKL